MKEVMRMEDRHLFKAKRLDNGEWVQGVPFEIEGKTVILINDNENLLRVHYLEENMWDAEICAIEVEADTICQYTGLKDKNGTMIWENDIVKINNSKVNMLITFREFEIICTIPNEKYYKHRLEYDTEYEVVGNIFDNPELLESEG